MKRKTIADQMVDILKENAEDGQLGWVVWYGSLDEIHECAKRAGMYEREGETHPLAINNRVLSALDRSDKFRKSYMKHVGRPARAFELKEEYRKG